MYGTRRHWQVCWMTSMSVWCSSFEVPIPLISFVHRMLLALKTSFVLFPLHCRFDIYFWVVVLNRTIVNYASKLRWQKKKFVCRTVHAVWCYLMRKYDKNVKNTWIKFIYLHTTPLNENERITSPPQKHISKAHYLKCEIKLDTGNSYLNKSV